MKLRIFSGDMLGDVLKLWNENVAPYSVYAPMTEKMFQEKFLNNPFVSADGLITAFDGDTLIGFGHAVYNNQDKPAIATPGYITCAAVHKHYWRRGIGTEILRYLEDFLRKNGKTYVRNLFFNPVKLEWHVPGYESHEHPNAPAIPFNSPFYFLLLANGYNVNGQEDAYHVNLENYELPAAVIRRMRGNEEEGYTIAIYDSSKHYGFDELFHALNNEDWRRLIAENLKKENPHAAK